MYRSPVEIDWRDMNWRKWTILGLLVLVTFLSTWGASAEVKLKTGIGLFILGVVLLLITLYRAR